ncbi:MAG: ribonuclease HII [Xanthomonadaceae bacterium]|nr:ribonuclease HII [Xanthomonadaceae bacterium]
MSQRYSLPQWPTLHFERQLNGRVCGIDEAGCAPLAGPVVAAAVVLPGCSKPRQLRGLTDSKLLSRTERARFYDIILQIAAVGVGLATVEEIERYNIFHADMLAMRRAFASLDRKPEFALVDGRATPELPCTAQALVKGDRRSLSIAAASVVAKVVRDRVMRKLAVQFPDYGWQTNVGYATDAHYLGLLRNGPCEHHRRGFAPLNSIFGPGGPTRERFRFLQIDGRPDLNGLELFDLRRDLHAVFEGRGHHVGMLKKIRGRWTFQAMGYDQQHQPLPQAGPCRDHHGQTLEQPDVGTLIRLFSDF